MAVLLLMFKKPTPVAAPMKREDAAAHADAFQEKISSLAPQPAYTNTDGSTSSQEVPAEVRFTVEEVQAALMQANDPAMAAAVHSAAAPTAPADQIAMPTSVPVVTFEKDIVKGQFQSELAGQEVIVTVEGHLGAKDGYATFEPTQFKIGEVIVPVSMVNGELQKKMAEQRDRLKLPDFISDISVQNGELVIKRK